jgi:hypothetical protein
LLDARLPVGDDGREAANQKKFFAAIGEAGLGALRGTIPRNPNGQIYLTPPQR